MVFVDVGPIALFPMKTFLFPTRLTKSLLAAAIAPPFSCEVVQIEIEIKECQEIVCGKKLKKNNELYLELIKVKYQAETIWRI